MIRDVPDCAVCYIVDILTRRSLYPLKDVESRHVVQDKESAMFGLPLEKDFSPLAVKLVDLISDSMEIASARFVDGNACSHSVMTKKRIYSYWLLENTPRFNKIYSAYDLLTRTLCTVYTAAGAGFNRRTLHVPSVLQLVQAPTSKYYTCRLCCSLCKLRLTNTTRAVCTAADAGSDLWMKCNFHAS